MPTPGDVKALKASAEIEVMQIGLDDKVRAASKLGTFDGGANWYFSYDPTPKEQRLLNPAPPINRSATRERSYVPPNVARLKIHATFDAGTNSAHVDLDRNDKTIRVYEASNFGKRLDIFRYGAWVDVVIRLAHQQHDAETAEQITEEDRQRAVEALKFTPLD